MGRFEDMTIERPVYLTNKRGRSQRSGVGQANYEWILGLFDEFPDADIQRIVYRALDNLPALPDDPSMYPVGGGLFRNGDSNGYTLTRLYGTRASTGSKIVDAMLSAFDAAPQMPDDQLAYQGLPPGYYRDGDGYTLTRLYGSSQTTGNRIVDQMLKMFDAAPQMPDDPLAFSGLARGYYRDGDENGYRIVRKT